MAEMTVDEFVQTKVLPELQPVVAMIRELMRGIRAQGEGADQLRDTGLPGETDHRGDQPDQEGYHLCLFTRGADGGQVQAAAWGGEELEAREDQDGGGGEQGGAEVLYPAGVGAG